jgi:hypothetical protein
MHYLYNIIFRRGLLNIFEAALHSGYLCFKVPTTFRIISVFDSQKDAENIDQCFAPDHKNVHFIREEPEQYQQQAYLIDPRTSAESKQAIEAHGETKKILVDPRVLDKAVL